ncbi:MAG: hypothetical protein MK239_10015 [Gemmatimonadetes bacterium]|nr:hypothetical protein [Gemmatimonadota bacterium]
MQTGNTSYKAAVALAVATVLILFWVIGAVGVLGADGDPADLMYIGVLAVGITGAIIVRFQPMGMARAMIVMALAQALVTVIALIIGKQDAPYMSVFEIVSLNSFFVSLFLGSARLFQKAARE